MELQEVLLKRRSVRRFSSGRIDREAIEYLLHAAMSGPSACNKTPWEFYVVETQEKIEELRKTTSFSKIEAPLAIVVAGNTERFMPGLFREFWVQDTSSATENILLAATDLGLGACWCGVYPVERSVKRVREVLGISEDVIPLNIIWLGHPGEQTEARDQYDADKVHYL